jgi:phosphohistidine phosphatase
MVIYFLRHASAGQPFDSPKRDEKRGLDHEGIAQCGLIGRFLAAADVQVEAIVSSPLKRAAQTAFLVGNEMGFEGKIQMEAALRPAGTFAEFRMFLEKHRRQEAILVVGHNPNLSEFVGKMISVSGCEAAVDLKKGAVARIELRRNSGELLWCVTPRVLRVLQATAADSVRPKSSRK